MKSKTPILIRNPSLQRQLVVHKLESGQSNYDAYHKALNSLLFDSNNFFSTTFKGKEVVFGKRSKNTNYSIPISRRKSSKTIRKSQKSIVPRGTNSRMSQFLRASSISHFGSVASASTSRFSPEHHDQHYIEDSELKKIYDDYKFIKEKNRSFSTNIIKDADPKIKTELGQIFEIQQKTLKNFTEEAKDKNRIMNYIAKRVKRSHSHLLMNQLSSYRIKKELRSQFAEEVSKTNPMSVNDWIVSLRDNGKVPNQSYYVNVGTVSCPRWQLIKRNAINKPQIIRKPNDKDFSGGKEIDLFFNSQYLQSRVSEEKFEKMRKTSKVGALDSLLVVGKDLLEFEQENAKMIKGRKVIANTEWEKDKNLKDTLVISKNVKLPVVIKSKNFFD